MKKKIITIMCLFTFVFTSMYVFPQHQAQAVGLIPPLTKFTYKMIKTIGGRGGIKFTDKRQVETVYKEMQRRARGGDTPSQNFLNDLADAERNLKPSPKGTDWKYWAWEGFKFATGVDLLIDVADYVNQQYSSNGGNLPNVSPYTMGTDGFFCGKWDTSWAVGKVQSPYGSTTGSASFLNKMIPYTSDEQSCYINVVVNSETQKSSYLDVQYTVFLYVLGPNSDVQYRNYGFAYCTDSQYYCHGDRNAVDSVLESSGYTMRHVPIGMVIPQIIIDKKIPSEETYEFHFPDDIDVIDTKEEFDKDFDWYQDPSWDDPISDTEPPPTTDPDNPTIPDAGPEPETKPTDSTWWQWLLKPLISLLDGISKLISSLIKLVTGLAKAIADAIGALFVPSDDYFSSFFDSIKKSFDSKLPLIKQLSDFFNGVKESSGDGSKPVIEVTLPDSYGGGTYSVIDFTYFDQYRNWILNFIRFTMWFIFLKRLYSRIPRMVY